MPGFQFDDESKLNSLILTGCCSESLPYFWALLEIRMVFEVALNRSPRYCRPRVTSHYYFGSIAVSGRCAAKKACSPLNA